MMSSRTFLFRETISQPVVAAFGAGGIAGAMSRTVVSPLERLKILMQIQSAGREAYKLSVGKALAKMWREEGWRGFMRGNGTNCIRIVPYSAVQFSSYNFYKRVCMSTRVGTRARRQDLPDCRISSNLILEQICLLLLVSFAAVPQVLRLSSAHIRSTLSEHVCPFNQLASRS